MTGNKNASVTTIYYLAKISGLAPFELTNNRLREGSRLQGVYPMILVATCLPVMILAFLHRGDSINSRWTNLSSTTDALILQIGYLGIITSLGTMTLRRARVVEIFDLLVETNDIFRRWGLQVDHDSFFKTGAIFASLAIIVFLLNVSLTLATFLFASKSKNVPIIELATICEHLFAVVYHQFVLTFVLVVKLIRKNFVYLNEQLSIGSRNPSTTGCIDVKLIQRFGNNPNRSRILFHSANKFQRIGKVYDNLCDVTEKLCDLFSLPLALIIFYYSVIFLIRAYYHLSYHSSHGTTGNPLEIILLAFRHVLVFGVMLTELVSIAVVSSSGQKLVKMTASALHESWNVHRSSEANNEMHMLSLQLLHRPLKISAFGFFSLDYSYLYKIFCTVAAYFIVMMQLDSTKN